eukprot:s2097_g22.t1
MVTRNGLHGSAAGIEGMAMKSLTTLTFIPSIAHRMGHPKNLAPRNFKDWRLINIPNGELVRQRPSRTAEEKTNLYLWAQPLTTGL